MDKRPKSIPGLLVFFGSLLLLANLLQAHFTELDPDEAYYWVYSRDLAWGYFDHPPMVALMIKAGYALLSSELGLRLMTILAQLGTLLIIWTLAGRPRGGHQLRTLMVLFMALPMLQVYGFITTPDAPLLFFSALFFWVYRRFTERPTVTTTLLLGMVMAALLYSKYHGILLIGFTVLSNLRLLLQARFYVAALFGLLLFFPHLYWQYSHDFPSFRYHLQGRDDPYELKHTLNYLINQLLIFSPLLIPFILGELKNFSPRSALERSFVWVIFGFWIFFFLMTFKGHAEPQWTAVLSIPFLLMLYRAVERRRRYSKLIFNLALFSAGLLFVARIVVAVPVAGLVSGFHDSAWAKALKERARDRTVIFENSYRDAAEYSFYAGEMAYGYTDIYYRRSQYDLMNWESKAAGDSILLALKTSWACPECTDFRWKSRHYQLRELDEWFFPLKVDFSPLEPVFYEEGADSLSLILNIVNPYDVKIQMGEGGWPLSFRGIFWGRDGPLADVHLRLEPPVEALPPRRSVTAKCHLPVPSGLSGRVDLGLGIAPGPAPPLLNSRLYQVELPAESKQ